MTPELVFLTPSDAPEASAFVRPIWVDTYAGIIYGGRERAELIFDDCVGPEKILRDMDDGHFFAYITDRGARVGLVSAGVHGRDLVVSKIYILPGSRRQGYGGYALRYMLEYGREKGCTRAVLEANPRNVPALRFYRKHGFDVIGTHDYECGPVYIMAAIIGYRFKIVHMSKTKELIDFENKN